MAILYITTNADSGDGSLRALLASANDGDSIVPDPETFPRGTKCEITLASALTIQKEVHIGGNGVRIALNGGGVAGRRVALQAPVVFTDVDFIGLYGASTGGAVYCATASESVLFSRCRVVGCGGSAVMYAGAGVEVVCSDCAIYGNKGTGTYAFIHQNAASSFTFNRCTRVYNLPATEAASGRDFFDENCVTTVGDFVLEPETWSDSDWTADSWRDWELKLENYVVDGVEYGDQELLHGSDLSDLAVAGLYDLDGNPRKPYGALGAWENIEADVFWTGYDENGNVVLNPSFESPDGWSASRWTYRACPAPAGSADTVFVDTNVTFAGTLDGLAVEGSAPVNGKLIVGGFSAVSGAIDGWPVELGFGSRLQFSGAAKIVENDNIDWDAIEVAASSVLTLEGCRLSTPNGALVIPANRTLDLDDSAVVNASLVVQGALLFSGGLALNSLTLEDGAVVRMLADDSFLTATTSATVGAASIIAPTRGYFATPVGTDVSAATFDDVAPCRYGANVSNPTATSEVGRVLFAWSRAEDDVPVHVEDRLLGAWRWLDSEYDGDSYALASVGRLVALRVFDGEKFLALEARGLAPPTVHETSENAVIGYVVADDVKAGWLQ